MSQPLQIADFNDYARIVEADAEKRRIELLAADIHELRVLKGQKPLTYLAQDEMEHMREMGEENL